MFADAPPSGRARFVGRNTELQLLLGRFARAREGRGQLVLVTGEAGVGKSRLVRAMHERLVDAPHRTLECRCSAYHQNSALYPVIDLLHRRLGFGPRDPPDRRLAKLERMVKRYGVLADALPLFAALLSVPLPEDCDPVLAYAPARLKQRTIEAVVELLVANASDATLVLVVEDLQWIDPSTHELLGMLAGRLGTAPILAIFTSRPAPMIDALTSIAVTRLALQRLVASDVHALVQHLAGARPLAADVLNYVTTKTDGIPLFVEELTKTILESGWLTESGGRYELSAALRSLPIPTSLQASLMTRIDRLASAKPVAQRAAALGRAFSYRLLHAVWPGDEPTLRRELGRLLDAELLFQRGSPPDETYVFKHALVQDATYQSLLKPTRQQYHREIAAALIRDFRETAEQEPEIVAHHYTEAGMREDAIVYWERAGLRAIQRSGNVEAINHLRTGLGLLEVLPPSTERTARELALQVALGAPMVMTRGYASPDVAMVYGRARDLCRELGETRHVFTVVWGLWMFHAVRSEFSVGRELAEQLGRIAHDVGDTALLVEAHMALGITAYHVGRFADALAHFDEVKRHYDISRHATLAYRSGQDPGAACLYYGAHALWLLGYPDRARARADEGYALIERLAHPHTRAVGLSFGAMLASFRREPDAARSIAGSAIALSTEHGFPFWAALAQIVHGWAVAMQGDGDAGIAEMRNGLSAFRLTGARMTWPHRLILLADALAHDGRFAEALDVLGEARVATVDTGETWWNAELERLTGELLLATSVANDKVAEGALRRAIDTAARQEAKSLELRATMPLVREWDRNGRRDEARALLERTLGWFTEGFSTPDLMAARSLLDKLR